MLDDQTRLTLQDVLLDIWKERRMTILFVTHNIEEALQLADRILGAGRILADGEVALERPRDRFADEFVDALMKLRRTFAEAVGAEGAARGEAGRGPGPVRRAGLA